MDEDLPDSLEAMRAQLSLQFNELVQEQVDSQKFDLEKLRREHREFQDRLDQNIIDHGYKILHARTVNDDFSVEADYGAPSAGLTFFKDFLDPQRYYRYPRIRNVEGDYKTHHEQSIRVGKFLARSGYKIFEGLREGQYPTHIQFFNGGVTRAFSELIRDLASYFKQHSEDRAPFFPPEKGAVLLPVPTYGLFITILEEILEGTNIEIIRVRRHDSGAVHQGSLQLAIDECVRKNQRILAYYECNPNNPTGYIRGEKETREIADILMRETIRRSEADIEIAENYKGDVKIPPHVHIHLAMPRSGVVMIDDMAYEGLEYTDDIKPFAFSQVSPEVAEYAVTLKGISKIGLPGARIGMMVGGNEILGSFAKPQLYHEFCANALGVDILSARYSDGDHQKKFKAHKKKLRKEHVYRGNVLETLFVGLERSSLSEKQKESLVRDYAAFGKMPEDSAKKLLNQGLPQFHIERGTQCGFFKIINTDNFRDKIFFMKQDDVLQTYQVAITSGWSLYYAFKSFDVDVIPLVWAGADDQSLDARISLSLEKADLFVLFERLKKMQDHFFGPAADIQMDLFRDYKPRLD